MSVVVQDLAVGGGSVGGGCGLLGSHSHSSSALEGGRYLSLLGRREGRGVVGREGMHNEVHSRGAVAIRTYSTCTCFFLQPTRSCNRHIHT